MAIDENEANTYESETPAMLEYVNQSFKKLPNLFTLTGSTSTELMSVNHANHVEFMATIFQIKSAVVLFDVIIWVYRSYASRGFSPDYFVYELQFWKEAVSMYVRPAESSATMHVYELMIQNHSNFLHLSRQSCHVIKSDETARPQIDEFVAAILKPSSADALASTRESIQTIEDVKFWWYSVIRPAMYEVGRLWSVGQITVAREHLATSITQRVMAAFYPIILDVPRNKGNVIFTASPGELHEIGPRMMADFLEIDGWNVLYTGADTPIDSVVDLLKTESARFLCISTTLPTNLSSTTRLIDAVRADPETENVKILVGGQAYNLDPLLWKKVGADRYANNSEDAARFLESCLDGQSVIL
jgi:methanogenic corrinoid protein MtbC1